MQPYLAFLQEAVVIGFELVTSWSNDNFTSYPRPSLVIRERELSISMQAMHYWHIFFLPRKKLETKGAELPDS